MPLVGEGWCFTLDALSTLAVIASLVAMRVAPRALPVRAGRGLRELKEGLAYVARTPVVGAVLALFTATSLLVGAYATMLPLLAGGPLHGGARTLGTLMGASGCGALTGALVLTVRTGRSGAARSRVVGPLTPLLANLGLAAALLLLEAARSTVFAAVLFYALGACLMMVTTSSNTIIQTTVDRGMMGRVMSLYAMGFYAGAPIGALVEGAIAKLVGPVHMFAIAGMGCLVGALAFGAALRRLRLRNPPSAPVMTPVADENA